jgi:hypothetical protein
VPRQNSVPLYNLADRGAWRMRCGPRNVALTLVNHAWMRKGLAEVVFRGVIRKARGNRAAQERGRWRDARRGT